MAESAVTSFKKTLEETTKETGYNYQVLHPNFTSVLSNGRIYAHWFEPGTVIASVEADGNVIIFDISGDLKADIFDPEGALTKTFEKTLTEIPPVDGLKLVSDKDVNALLSEGGLNGYKMDLYEGNVVRVYLEAHPEVFVYAKHPSVARAIVNVELVEELLSRVPEESEEEQVQEETDAFALAHSEEAEVMEDAEFAEEESVSEEKKPAKKTAKKKSAKKASEAPMSVEARYDLLPLDVIGSFLDKFGVMSQVSFFSAIEGYKKGSSRLLDAAVAIAQDVYADGPEAVMKLACIAAGKTEAAGDAPRDSLYYINDAVNEYLLHLRSGDDETDHIANILWDMICGEAAD